jgi:hypothetical protein
MSDQREHDLLWKRLEQIEGKVDKLLDFRGWVLGAVAAISAGVSVLVAVIAGLWSPTK